MGLRQSHVTIDCADPAALAAWWAELLGWRVARADADEAVARPADDAEEATLHEGRMLPLLFVRVPDAKATKNRVHLDLLSDDVAADVARAEALGAQRVDVGQDAPPWVVLADPEGNELCIVPMPDA